MVPGSATVKAITTQGSATTHLKAGRVSVINRLSSEQLICFQNVVFDARDKFDTQCRLLRKNLKTFLS